MKIRGKKLILAMMLIFAISGFGQKIASNQSSPVHSVRPAEMSSLIEHADKIEVYDSTPTIYEDGTNPPRKPLYSSENLEDISELRNALRVQPPKNWFKCACIPRTEIVLLRQEKQLAVISIQDGLTVGLSVWDGDARLLNPEEFLKWLDTRAIDDPRRRYQDLQRTLMADRNAERRWRNVLPARLRPLWTKVMKDNRWSSDPVHAATFAAANFKPEIEKDFRDPRKRILFLFSWFGSGAGPWSGYPVAEDVPQLLLGYQRTSLVEALSGRRLTDSELEGAARFFAGYDRVTHLPDDLRKELLAHSLKSSIPDNVERARKVFGE